MRNFANIYEQLGLLARKGVVDLQDVLDALSAQPMADWHTFQPIRTHIMQESGKALSALAGNQPGQEAIFWPNFGGLPRRAGSGRCSERQPPPARSSLTSRTSENRPDDRGRQVTESVLSRPENGAQQALRASSPVPTPGNPLRSRGVPGASASGDLCSSDVWAGDGGRRRALSRRSTHGVSGASIPSARPSRRCIAAPC